MDLFRTAEEKSTSFGAVDCSIMSLLLQRGAGWRSRGLGETVSIRTLNTHQYVGGKKTYDTDLVAAEPVFSSRCRSGLC